MKNPVIPASACPTLVLSFLKKSLYENQAQRRGEHEHRKVKPAATNKVRISGFCAFLIL